MTSNQHERHPIMVTSEQSLYFVKSCICPATQADVTASKIYHLQRKQEGTDNIKQTQICNLYVLYHVLIFVVCKGATLVAKDVLQFGFSVVRGNSIKRRGVGGVAKGWLDKVFERHHQVDSHHQGYLHMTREITKDNSGVLHAVETHCTVLGYYMHPCNMLCLLTLLLQRHGMDNTIESRAPIILKEVTS